MITFTVDQRACDGGVQLSINEVDESGAGSGYRIAGPKYDGNGKTLIRHTLTQSDVKILRTYLRRVSKDAAEIGTTTEGEFMSQYRKDFREVQSEFYWTGPRIFLMTVFGVLLLGVVGFGIRYIAMEQFGFFAPKYEAIRRDVMIESRAYSEATTRRMYELKLQHETAPSDDAKATIRAMALHEARAFDKARLPRDLQIFITQLGG